MINTCFYYYIAKKEEEELKMLTGVHNKSGKGFALTLQELNQEIADQLWMLKLADLEGIFYLYHCSTGLTIEANKDYSLDLHHNRNKDTQKIKLTLVSAEKMEYTLSVYATNAVLMMKEGNLSSEPKKGENETIWTLKKANKNKSLSNSAILESDRSGYVLDVNDNAEKEESSLIQNQWSGMFSQRWKFQKFKNFYFIRNAKSDMVVGIKGKKSKEGADLIQEKQSDENYKCQLWSIEQRGFNLYSIRLASEQQLFIGVAAYYKEKASAELVHQSSKHLWRILGASDL